MDNGIVMREGVKADRDALEKLYPAAFPEEDLLPLLDDLLSESEGVFSLVATKGGVIVGNIIFTICSVDERSEKIGMLAPLAVNSNFQRQGIGSALIKEGFDRLKNQGIAQVNVFGDPAYYGRFGFKADDNVSPPCDVAPEWRPAWQYISLTEVTLKLEGKLIVPKLWRKPAYWLP